MAYVCKSCEALSTTYVERCGRCCRWGTLAIAKATVQKRHLRAVNGYVDGDESDEDQDGEEELATAPVRLDRVSSKKVDRIPTNIPAFDKLLGGGLVRGLTYIIAGDPGAGKSTFVLQIIKSMNVQTYYASAEEAEKRIKSRARRLKVPTSLIHVWHEPDVREHLDSEELAKAELGVWDSLGDLHDSETRSQSKLSTLNAIREYGDQDGQEQIEIVISHLTKDGKTAGPNSIEHKGDCTIDLMLISPESEDRILRVRKNREGKAPVQINVTMSDSGLVFPEVRTKKGKKG